MVYNRCRSCLRPYTKSKIMSRKFEKTDKKIPNGSPGFSLNPGLTDCSDFPEQSTTYKQSGQSGPTIKTQIENLLRGIPLKIPVSYTHLTLPTIYSV